MLEPQRTNVLPYSQDFSHSSWLKNDVSIQSGYLAPDGTNNAYKVTSTGTNPHLVNVATGGNTGAKSIYAKTTSGTGTVILFNNVTTYFTITEEWQRFEIEQDGLDFFYAVDFRGASTLTEIIIWGAQSEAGSYATSLINTQGSAVTRVEDACSQTVPSGIIGQTEGVIFLDFKKEHNALETWSINDGTTSNRVYMGFNDTNFISQVRSSGGAAQASFTTALNNNTRYKCALAYKLNDFVLYINGVQIGTDNNGVVPLNMSKLSAYASTFADAPFFSPTNDVKLYNTRLSNSELAALTTI